MRRREMLMKLKPKNLYKRTPPQSPLAFLGVISYHLHLKMHPPPLLSVASDYLHLEMKFMFRPPSSTLLCRMKPYPSRRLKKSYPPDVSTAYDDYFDHDHVMDDNLIYDENVKVGNPNNDEDVEVDNPNNDEEVEVGNLNNDVLYVEIGNNNNDDLDVGVDNPNYDEGEHNNNVKNYNRGYREGVLRPEPRRRTLYSSEQELRVRKKTKRRKPKN